MDPIRLVRELEEFLATAPRACVLEGGETTFDLTSAKYSVTGEKGKCLLHLWSQERNSVRRIVDLERKNGQLNLAVQGFGKGKPTGLEIVSDRERQPPAMQRQARMQDQRLLARAMQRNFPDWNVEGLVSTVDLERSFSPVYTRGLLRRGRSTICILGVNDSELQASVDGALTFALLWFHYCRERDAARSVIAGLRLFVPRGRSAVIQARMHYLHRAAFHFELFEFDERTETFEQLDLSDQGNIATRLVHCADASRVEGRFRSESIAFAPPFLNAKELSSAQPSLHFACMGWSSREHALGITTASNAIRRSYLAAARTRLCLQNNPNRCSKI